MVHFTIFVSTVNVEENSKHLPFITETCNLGESIYNLLNTLTTRLYAKYSYWLPELPNGTFKCDHCEQCDIVVKSKDFAHPVTKQPYTSKYFINCKMTHAAHVLSCSLCDAFYVGRMKQLAVMIMLWLNILRIPTVMTLFLLQPQVQIVYL